MIKKLKRINGKKFTVSLKHFFCSKRSNELIAFVVWRCYNNILNEQHNENKFNSLKKSTKISDANDRLKALMIHIKQGNGNLSLMTFVIDNLYH